MIIQFTYAVAGIAGGVIVAAITVPPGVRFATIVFTGMLVGAFYGSVLV